MSFPSIGPSTRDCRVTVAKALAAHLLTVPYAVYWYDADVLQSDAATYWSTYRAQHATHLLNGTLQSQLTASVGVFSIVEPPDATRDWVVAPSVDGTVPPLGTLPIPSAVVDVDPVGTGNAFELGTGRRWRDRTISIECLVRNPLEQDLLADALVTWFPVHGHLAIRNWDSGDGATVVGTLEWTSAVPSVGTSWADASPVQYHTALVLNGTFVA